MSIDTLLTAVNVISGMVLIGIGIEMVNNPPDKPWKKWTYRALFGVFGTTVVVTTLLQAARNDEAQKQARADLHSDQLANQTRLSYMQGTLDTISKFVTEYVTHPPIQSTKFDPTWAMAVLRMAQASPPVSVAPTRIGPRPQGTASQHVDPQPTILSEPPIFADEGQITGKYFGSTRGDVYLHVRVKPSAQQGPYRLEGVAGPDRLLGNLDLTNKLSVGDHVQDWSDTSIRIKLPRGYWQGIKSLMTDTARSRNLPAPASDDLQLGVAVVPAGVEWNPQFRDFFYGQN